MQEIKVENECKCGHSRHAHSEWMDGRGPWVSCDDWISDETGEHWCLCAKYEDVFEGMIRDARNE